MILLVYHVVSTSNISFFYFFIFVFLYCTKCIYKSFKSFLICTRFPFHNRYSAFGFSLTNLRSFPSPIRKYAAASSIDNVYLFHMNQAWIQLRAQKQFITTASDFLFYALIYRNAQRVKYSGQMQKILFFCFCLSHIQKKNGVFTGC